MTLHPTGAERRSPPSVVQLARNNACDTDQLAQERVLLHKHMIEYRSIRVPVGLGIARIRGTVILKYTNGEYILAEEMMKRSFPSEDFSKKRIPTWRKALRGHDPDWPPRSFIQTLTDLVFTGNGDKASKFVDRVWPKDLAGKDAFLRSYREALNESRYYSKAARYFDNNY